MARELQGKTIVITGASSGIGAATAAACARAGMDVVLGARREAKLAEAAGAVEAAGRTAVTAACDVTDPQQVAALFERGWETLGRIDAAFANAGHGLCASMLDMTESDHREIFEVNYFGTTHTLREAVGWMRKTDGALKHLLVCSSAASKLGLPYFGAYSATKAAQEMVADAIRGELAPERFSVTSVHPVGTRTEFFNSAAERSGRTFSEETPNTPPWMAQDAETVARKVVKAISCPRSQVWPVSFVRFGLAITAAFPTLGARAMREQARRIRENG